MGLRFYFGPSDEDRSRVLYEEMIALAMKNPKTNILILVPDQFTMSTQKKLVDMHPRGGILNIDVLSFGRLGHRVLEEVNTGKVPVLDDTGKSLVLSKVAAGLVEQLPALGGHLHKQGYIHEVKSAISEFMQYGISPDELESMIEFSKSRGALAIKLRDLQTIYREFLQYIRGNYITTEETLDVLRRMLERSKLVKESIVVLDGFTGFTPIQNRLVQELMRLSKETIVSLTLGVSEDPYTGKGEQDLFALSKKTVGDLEKLASQIQIERDRTKDVFLKEDETKTAPLRYLESNLFRYGRSSFTGKMQGIRLFEATEPREEVHQAGLLLQQLVYEKQLAYRDIAVVVGDLEGYAPYVESEFRRLSIPCFIDRTRGIVLNPMIEYIKSGLKLYLNKFSYEAVLHYLRSGLTDLPMEDVDLLENYILRTGIRGYRSYSRLFDKKNKKERDEEALQALNSTREKMMSQIEALHLKNRCLAKVYVEALYEFLVSNRIQEKMEEYRKAFEEKGDLVRAREYAQIYRLVMELLDQIYVLLGEEEITYREFYDILEAGFGEIEVGTIPQNVDRVLVGDIERTRLQSVKALFFLGVNDGNIPKSGSVGGVISDMDREFLRESDFELAPSPRQQIFIQKFYLYLNLTKPTEYLTLSLSKMNNQGKSIRPAYLVDLIKKMYSVLEVEVPQKRDFLEQIDNPTEGLDYLATGLRHFVEGNMAQEKLRDFYTLYEAYDTENFREKRQLLTDAAFRRYTGSYLASVVARALYGMELENSVTRLEKYSACAYSHFLAYGLSLRERELFGFEAVDMGNVYHNVLEGFSAVLQEKKMTWFDFTQEFAENTISEVLEQFGAVYGENVLHSNFKNEYMMTRLKRILLRTVLTLQQQLKKGSFLPDGYEVSFSKAQSLESMKITLSEKEKMYLRGRIDRVDVAEDDRHVYVKVVDYKSGDKKFELAALYYGLQLQLVVYMNAALELQLKKHPEKDIVPAAMLYYHIDDPLIEDAHDLTEEQVQEKIVEELRTRGMVNSDLEVVSKLDESAEGRSAVIPVEIKKDNTLSTRSSVLSREEFKELSDYVTVKMKRIGQKMLQGDISLNPYEMGDEKACTYCEYKKVCGFDTLIPGCEIRELAAMKKEEVFEKIEKEL